MLGLGAFPASPASITIIIITEPELIPIQKSWSWRCSAACPPPRQPPQKAGRASHHPWASPACCLQPQPHLAALSPENRGAPLAAVDAAGVLGSAVPGSLLAAHTAGGQDSSLPGPAHSSLACPPAETDKARSRSPLSGAEEGPWHPTASWGLSPGGEDA